MFHDRTVNSMPPSLECGPAGIVTSAHLQFQPTSGSKSIGVETPNLMSISFNFYPNYHCSNIKKLEIDAPQKNH